MARGNADGLEPRPYLLIVAFLGVPHRFPGRRIGTRCEDGRPGPGRQRKDSHEYAHRGDSLVLGEAQPDHVDHAFHYSLPAPEDCY